VTDKIDDGGPAKAMTTSTNEDRETARDIVACNRVDELADAILAALTAAREESASRLLLHPPKGCVMLDTGEIRRVVGTMTFGDGSVRLSLAAKDAAR
jgi:RNase P/RNase MRP subunit POP5